MNQTLGSFLEDKRSMLNQQMEQQIYSMQIPETLRESIMYSIEAGGKRIRPVLLLAANEAFGGEENRAIAPACAVEMVHTYSLIHDDLPAMDDDDVRRGKPTNHVQFDEATAILAGDGLLTAAFHVVTSNDHLSDREKVFLTRELSKASGAEGMVAGQMLDMEAEGQTLTLEGLEAIHRHKTGELIRFSAVAGAFIGGANPSQLHHIETYSKYIGLLFQVQDDILDVVGEEGEIGKPVGSDVSNNKSTYPQLLGLEGAIEHKNQYAERARMALKEAGVESTLLEDLIDFISDRKN